MDQRISGLRPRSALLAIALAAFLCPTVDAGEPAKPDAGPAIASLPRFQRLWSREGLGRFEGVGAKGVYYAVANDGRSVHALDVQSGKTLWQKELAEPMSGLVRLHVAHERLVVVGAGTGSGAGLAAFAIRDGSPQWSRTITCENADSRGSLHQLFLICRNPDEPAVVECVEINVDDGAERGRLRSDKRVEVARDGSVCGRPRRNSGAVSSPAIG